MLEPPAMRRIAFCVASRVPFWVAVLGLAALGAPLAAAQTEQALAQAPEAETPPAPDAPDAPDAPAAATTADPITAALLADPALAAYNDHLVFLASPFLEGRLPGTRGMEIAREYVEHWFRAHGLQPAFAGSGGAPSYRQDFDLSSRASLVGQSFALVGSDEAFEPNVDYGAVRFGRGGAFEGPAVFVGYSIADGPDGYTNYADGAGELDLTGKVAVMLRFEPMDAAGRSRWSESGWSRRAQFDAKIRAARGAGAAAVVMLNTPGAADPRVEQLIAFNSMPPAIDGPGIGLSIEAGERLCAALGHPLEELKRRADEEGGFVDLGHHLALGVEVEEESQAAQNVGGLLPGRGALAGELIVIGGHLDHLGMGEFGSRGEAGKLHPGADDNASGAAALILLADRLVDAYASLPEDAAARSILVVAFDAEESGLNGSRHYVANPILPLERHALMINFDMIGRIVNNRLAVTGVETATGLEGLVQPIFDASPLDVVTSRRGGGGSDHLPFLQRRVPALFAILADIREHPDYHTPGDTSDKINRVAALQTVDLFEQVALAAATHPDPFEFQADSGRPAAAGAPRVPGVRLGIMPAAAEGDGLGILVGNVSLNTAAAEAGIRTGDLMLRWNGAKIEDVSSWMETLSEHSPGDEVQVGLRREGEEITVTVTLRGR